MRGLEMIQAALRAKPRRRLVTGVAGFIGSKLAEWLREADQQVIGLDNFATGKRARSSRCSGARSNSPSLFIIAHTRSRKAITPRRRRWAWILRRIG